MLITLEGIDGSGKGTQAAKLVDRLKAEGFKVGQFAFPRYGQTIGGKAVGRYLNGEFGPIDQVHPLLASTLYAMDRFESREMMFLSLADSDVVVCDRYIHSNLAHQCPKLEAVDDQLELAMWIKGLEHGLFCMPKPDLVVQLDLPAWVAEKLIATKPGRDYTDKKADIHEADLDYLEKVRGWYKLLAADAAILERRWAVVPVNEGETIRRIDDVAEDVWAAVKEVVRKK